MREAALQPKEDLYTGIHKALRALLCDTLARAGAMDAEDGEETATVLAAVRNLVDLTRHHLHHENQHVHPLLEARASGATASLIREHVEHEEAFERLEAVVRTVEQACGAARDAAALALYRELALYAAEDFRHMHEEETRTNALLWERCTDAELKAAHHAIVSGIAPELMARYVRWLVPSMTPAERAALLAGARASVPPQEFAGMLQRIRPLIGEAGWRKLGRALELPRAA